MSGGFKVESSHLIEFGKHLEQLEGGLRDSASVVGGCVGDVGIFGLVGQIFGAGATMWCGKAEGQLGDYASTIADFADKLNKAAQQYEAGDDEALSSISRYQL